MDLHPIQVDWSYVVPVAKGKAQPGLLARNPSGLLTCKYCTCIESTRLPWWALLEISNSRVARHSATWMPLPCHYSTMVCTCYCTYTLNAAATHCTGISWWEGLHSARILLAMSCSANKRTKSCTGMVYRQWNWSSRSRRGMHIRCVVSLMYQLET